MAEAEKSNQENSGKRRIRKAAPSMRQQAEAARSKADKPARTRRIRSVGSSVKRPVRAARRIGGKTYYLPMPDNKVGRFLNKRRSFMPRYFINSWKELRQVTWPGRRETWRLTLAVFIFSLVFGTLIAIVDKGLETTFKDFILK